MIFNGGSFLFDVDVGVTDQSCFHYTMGMVGGKFNLYWIGWYLLHYASHHEYTLPKIGEEYADYVKRVHHPSGTLPMDREFYSSKWINCDSDDRLFAKTSAYSPFLDFSAYFLLDKLALGYQKKN